MKVPEHKILLLRTLVVSLIIHLLLESNEKLTVKPYPLNCTRKKVKQIMDFVTCYILTH